MLTPEITYSALLMLMGAHIVLILVQVIGSLWIKRLSPNWVK